MRLKIDIQFSSGKDVTDRDVERIKNDIRNVIEKRFHTLIVNEIELELY